MPSLCPAPNTETEPLLTWKKAQDMVPWNIILLLGGGFAMAKGCEVSASPGPPAGSGAGGAGSTGPTGIPHFPTCPMGRSEVLPHSAEVLCLALPGKRGKNYAVGPAGARSEPPPATAAAATAMTRGFCEHGGPTPKRAHPVPACSTGFTRVNASKRPEKSMRWMPSLSLLYRLGN